MSVADEGPLDAGAPQLAVSRELAFARRSIASATIDPDAERHRRRILDFLDAHPDALHRSCRTGHLTGSAVVVDPAGARIVLLFHRKLQRWLQPGGHCDGDANLAAVALREATEETGLSGLSVHPTAIDLDVHRVDPPGEGSHLHLDARFLAVAPGDADPPGNHESTQVRWVPVADLGDYRVDAGTHRMVHRALAVLGAGHRG